MLSIPDYIDQYLSGMVGSRELFPPIDEISPSCESDVGNH
jgi:hypothetical protein